MGHDTTNIPDGAKIRSVYGLEYTVKHENSKTPGHVGIKEPLYVGAGVNLYEFPVTWIASVTPPEKSGPSADYYKDVFEAAADYGYEISFTYEKPDGDVSERTIEPTGVELTQHGKYIVYGRLDDGEIKGFRLDRIKGKLKV